MIRLQSIRSGSTWASASVIVVAFMSLTGMLALRLNIWQDEAYTLHTTSHGLVNALREGTFYEAQAPLYFGLLELWRTLNDTAFFARLLSIVFSIVTIGISWSFAKRYLKTISATVVAAAVAFNPFTVWATVEARPYSLAIMLSTALLYYFFRGYIDDDANWRDRIAFIFIAILGAYTQYYLAAFVPAGICSLIVLRRFAALKQYVVAVIAVGIALLPIAYVLPLQLKAYSVLPFTASRFAPFAIALAPFEFLYPHGWIGSWAHLPLKNALYFALAALPALTAYGRIQKLNSQSIALATLVVSLCFGFGIMIGIAHLHVIWPRYTVVLFMPTLFVAFAFFGDVSTGRRELVVRVFLCIYFVFAVLSLYSLFKNFSTSGDWRRVGDYLSANVSSKDAVAVFDAEASLPLQYYFHSLPVTSIPRALLFDRFDETRFVIRNEAELAASLGKVGKDHPHLWLVINDVCRTDATFYGCGLLDSYVARNFRTIGVAHFDRSSILELRPVKR